MPGPEVTISLLSLPCERCRVLILPEATGEERQSKTAHIERVGEPLAESGARRAGRLHVLELIEAQQLGGFETQPPQPEPHRHLVDGRIAKHDHHIARHGADHAGDFGDLRATSGLNSMNESPKMRLETMPMMMANTSE